jgi:5-methylcytosine-specific restriction endonuclease McrA
MGKPAEELDVCPTFQDLLSYLSGDVDKDDDWDEGDDEEIGDHIHDCPRCQSFKSIIDTVEKYKCEEMDEVLLLGAEELGQYIDFNIGQANRWNLICAVESCHDKWNKGDERMRELLEKISKAGFEGAKFVADKYLEQHS